MTLDLSVAAFGLGPEPLVLLLAAFLIDAVIGGVVARLPRVEGPMGLVDAAARFLEPRLNRRTRSVTDRLIRGLLLALVIVSATVFVALVLAAIGAAIPYGWVLVLVLIFVLVRQRGPFEQARAMVRDLEGRSDSLGADVVNDAHRAARETIEALAARLADGPVAAAFWYALLGLPGLAGYWAISILATRLDERNPQYAAFGMAATRLNEAVLFLPGAITGLLIVVASAFVPGGNPASAFRTMGRDWSKAYPRAHGFALAAVAGAFALNLNGPERQPTGWHGWIGDSGWRARTTSADLRRVLFVYGITCLLNTALIALLAMATFAL